MKRTFEETQSRGKLNVPLRFYLNNSLSFALLRDVFCSRSDA